MRRFHRSRQVAGLQLKRGARSSEKLDSASSTRRAVTNKGAHDACQYQHCLGYSGRRGVFIEAAVLKREFPNYWLSRLIISCWAGSNVVVGIFRPDSLTAEALVASGRWACRRCTCLASWSPSPSPMVSSTTCCPSDSPLLTIRYRHLGFMGMAIVMVMIAGVIGRTEGASMFLIAYLLPAAFATAVTFLDLFWRHRRRQG